MLNQNQETYENAIIIDTQTKEPLDKEALLSLLKKHHVKTRPVEKNEIRLEDVIPTLKKAKILLPEAFFKDLAAKSTLKFLSYNKVKAIYKSPKAGKLITVLPYPIINKYKIIPLQVNGGMIDLAVDNPLDKRVLMTVRYLFSSWAINLQVVSTHSIDWAIDNIYREIHRNTAMLDLYNRTPDQSAHKVLYPHQKYFLIGVIAVVALAFLINAVATFVALFASASILYFIFNPIKIYISLRGFKGARSITKVSQTELESVTDAELPVYTILIPVFHESEMLARNLKNMYNLNYPKNKLDIKVLMEENDAETIGEARRLGLFGKTQKQVEGIPKEEYTSFLELFDPIVVPAAKITTKPRACNYGLLRAKGELVVIYDAEDKPDPDQLRKAATVFLHSPKDLMCLQSKLNFYNADENILTRWFSIEYANWYEFYLQGLDWIEAPIPLGGTSNHFRKDSLDELGRWDPYNVTEDADIGIRLARQNLKTEMIDSYTYEEATNKVYSWIKQRSRWYKGHVQTYFVHMRHPLQLLKDLGASKFVKLQFTFGTSVVIPIINPILWVITALSFLVPFNWGLLTPGIIQLICLCNMIVGNASYLAIYILACAKLKTYRHIPYALLMPIYWALLSVASWRGLIQLIKNPFYWDKTSHGVSKTAAASKGT
jgi:cellulose synthase/poly-beta-1,6-N-acetylglucosamine synthase-like glycosyltransferase